MAIQDFAVALVGALREVVRPLDDAFDSPAAAGSLLLQHGWAPPTDPAYVDALSGQFNVAVRLAALVTPLEEILGQPDPSPDDIAAALDAGIKFIEAVAAFASGPPPSDSGLLGADFWREFPRDLYSSLFATYFRIHHPLLFALLRVGGVILQTEESAADRPGRVTYTRTDIRWGRLVDLVTDPSKVARSDFGWGTTLNYPVLFTRLRESLAVLNVWSGIVRAQHPFVEDYYAEDNPALAGLLMLKSTLYRWQDRDGSTIDVSFLLLPIPASNNHSGPPVGLLIAPIVTGDTSTAIGLGGPFVLSLYGGFESDAPVGIELRPDSIDLAGPSLTDSSAAIGATLAIQPRDPWILAGTADSSRLEIMGGSFSIEATGSPSNRELTLKLASDVIRLVLDPVESDGFVSSLIGTAPPPIEGSVSIAWSSQRGLIFGGSSSLDVGIPINLSLGAISLSYLRLAILPDKGKVAAFAGLSGSAIVGPLGVTIQDIGVAATLLPHAAGDPVGNFGDLDVTFGFKPPTGLGLSIDTSTVTGGGFLSCEPDLGRYSGALHIKIADTIDIAAWGILRTGSATEHWSLAIILAGHIPPIELGWNFWLTALGGLVALNRRMDTDALRDAVYGVNGSLDDLLFPDSPETRIPQLFSTIERFFPLAAGSYVAGPMVEIDWGRGVVNARIRAVLLLQLDEEKIALYGTVRVGFPDIDHDSTLRIRAAFEALVDPRDEMARFSINIIEAKLFESIQVSGGAAFFVRWGSDRKLVFTIGGFHPSYRPFIPKGLIEPPRVAVHWNPVPLVQLDLALYFAITSTSMQFGVAAHAVVGCSWGNVTGELGFDVLVVRNPLHLEADLHALVSVTVFGADLLTASLDGTIVGPSSWVFSGKVSFKMWIFHISKHFHFDWGDLISVLATPQSAGQLLAAEIQSQANWTSFRTRVLAVKLRSGVRAPLAPRDEIEVRQSSLPFNTWIETMDGNPLSDPGVWNLTCSSASGIAKLLDVTEVFPERRFLAQPSKEQPISRWAKLWSSPRALRLGYLCRGHSGRQHRDRRHRHRRPQPSPRCR